MSLNKGKHIIEEINGVRCTLVEKGIGPDRAGFLTRLLTGNGFTVKTAGEGDQLTLGVTDLVFNPTIAVYQQRLKTESGQKVSPAFWNQSAKVARSEYWEETGNK